MPSPAAIACILLGLCSIPVYVGCAAPPPTQVEGRFRLVDVGLGEPIGDGTLTFDELSINTDNSGWAPFSLATESDYVVRADVVGYAQLLMVGRTAIEDFEYNAYLADRELTDQIFRWLGYAYDPERGGVMVGLQRPSGAAAVGAAAELNVDHDYPFVIEGTLPVLGSFIPYDGLSVMSFPNVEPGQVQVSVTPPQGKTCSAFPDGASRVEIPVEADHMTMLIFVCE